MNQGSYFGQYKSGFQTLPKYAYEMMTAPTQQLAKTIGQVAGGIGGIAQKYMDQKAGTEAFQQGAAAQYKGLESLSQATGVPMNPELANQYANVGNMSPEQQAMFNQSMGQEAQRYQTIYGINQRQGQVYNQSQGRSLISEPYDPFGTNTSIGGSNAGGGAATKMSAPNPFPTAQGGVPALPTASPASSVLPLSPGFGASLVPELSPEQIDALERAYMQMRRAGR